MNQEQVLSAVRWLMTTVGMTAVSHGYVGSGTWEMWTGVAIVAAPLIWGVVSKTQAAMVAAVNKLPTVKGVVVTPDAAGTELVMSVNAPAVVKAGTPMALEMAKKGN